MNASQDTVAGNKLTLGKKVFFAVLVGVLFAHVDDLLVAMDTRCAKATAVMES